MNVMGDLYVLFLNVLIICLPSKATDTLRKVFGLLNESTHKQRLELVDELCKVVCLCVY